MDEIMKHFFLVILISMLFCGCVASRNVRVARLYADDPIWQTLSPKDPNEVIITEGDLKRKYKPIAKIFIDSVGSKVEISFDRMREEASKIGADAVVNIEVKNQYEGQEEYTNLYTGITYKLGPVRHHYIVGTAVIFE